MYRGLLDRYPAEFSDSEDLEVHGGKLAVLSSLLHRLQKLQEKIVVVSNHTKVSKSIKYLNITSCIIL